jgi:EAL domain-containing protein (putative c-di-GMP-specific phosphodiesterase class I)
MLPLKKPENAHLITKEAFKHIFSELEVINSYNNIFLSNLEKRFAQWSVHQKLGIFIVDIVH